MSRLWNQDGQLLAELSGTLAIGSTARAVFVVQAASSDMADNRVVFEAAKASDCKPDFFKEHGARSAWHRANNAFEKADDFDWHAWDNPMEVSEQRRPVTPEMVRAVMSGKDVMKLWAVCDALKAEFNVGKSTAARALGENGYLRHRIKPSPKGGFMSKRSRRFVRCPGISAQKRTGERRETGFRRFRRRRPEPSITAVDAGRVWAIFGPCQSCRPAI